MSKGPNCPVVKPGEEIVTGGGIGIDYTDRGTKDHLFDAMKYALQGMVGQKVGPITLDTIKKTLRRTLPMGVGIKDVQINGSQVDVRLDVPSPPDFISVEHSFDPGPPPTEEEQEIAECHRILDDLKGKEIYNWNGAGNIKVNGRRMGKVSSMSLAPIDVDAIINKISKTIAIPQGEMIQSPFLGIAAQIEAAEEEERQKRQKSE